MKNKDKIKFVHKGLFYMVAKMENFIDEWTAKEETQKYIKRFGYKKKEKALGILKGYPYMGIPEKALTLRVNRIIEIRELYWSKRNTTNMKAIDKKIEKMKFLLYKIEKYTVLYIINKEKENAN